VVETANEKVSQEQRLRSTEEIVKDVRQDWPDVGTMWDARGNLPEEAFRTMSLVIDPVQIASYGAIAPLDPDLRAVETQLCEWSFPWFAAHWLWIVNKDAEEQTLILNDPQWMYRSSETDRDVILKARKEGMSTYTLAEYYYDALFGQNTTVLIMTHRDESSEELYTKVEMFDRLLPDFFRPNRIKHSRRELHYDVWSDGRPLQARFLVARAGSREFGRGGDLDRVLFSEYAFYTRPKETLPAVMEALRRGSKAKIETTANGRNFFYDDWKLSKKGEWEFRPFFLPWFADPTNMLPLEKEERIEFDREEDNLVNAYDLTAEQMKWRRAKIKARREKFAQEFPENEEDPFLFKTGRVYPAFDPNIHVIHRDEKTGKYPPIKDDWKRYRAIDFGVNNPFACLWIAVNKDAEVHVYHEIYERGKRTEEHVPLIRARSREKKFEWTVCDHDLDGRLDLHAGGVPTVKAMKKYSTEFGIDLIRKLLDVKVNGRPSLFIYEDCKGLINEFLNYAKSETAGETQSEHPKKEWDHACDALRYFAVRWSRETGHFWPVAA